MRKSVKSLAFGCGLALVVFSGGAGSARAQSSSSFMGPATVGSGAFAPLAGFYQSYGYRALAPPVAFTNPPVVTVPKVLTSYVPSYEGIQPFYGSRFTGGAYRPMAYYYQR